MSKPPQGLVLTVFRGGCAVVFEDRVVELRLIGRHAHSEVALAVGDDVSFDPERGIVLELLPRRTRLSRLRPLAGRRVRPNREEQVIAANMDLLGIVVSVSHPPFRAGLVDRFALAARAGGLEAILIVNKIDLLEGDPLPDEVKGCAAAMSLFPVSAHTGDGLAPLREHLRGTRTVLGGHSGVGKSSLLNALEPELRIEIGALSTAGRGSHTTTRAVLFRLPGDALVVDTPGIRELETGALEPELVIGIYPEIERAAQACRFRDCRHDREPSCGVRDAVEQGSIPASRYASYRRLVDEVEREARTTARRGR